MCPPKRSPAPSGSTPLAVSSSPPARRPADWRRTASIARRAHCHHWPLTAWASDARRCWRPGMNWDAVGELDPHTRHPMNEGAWDPQARLADMDAMGIDQTLLYPTWFAEGFFLVRDPDVAYALAPAYNDWIADFCKTAPQQLFAAAILPLQDMDFALEELQRVAL